MLAADCFANRAMNRATMPEGTSISYEERFPSSKDVMACVIGFQVERSRQGRQVNVKVDVMQLYEYAEILSILDSLQSYRAVPSLQDIDLESDNHDANLLSSDLFKQARVSYRSLLEKLKSCFNSFPDCGQHKFHHVALSNYVTNITPGNVKEVFKLAFNHKIVENVAPNGSPSWPSPENISKMINSKTVVYTHTVDTKTWQLHPLILSERDMIDKVLVASSQALRAASPAIVNGMLNIIRRHVYACLSRITTQGCVTSRDCALEPPCPFTLFCYIIFVTPPPQDQDIKISWNQSSRTWTAIFKGPATLERQFGVGWSNFSTSECTHLQVTPDSDVTLCYNHDRPDKLRLSMSIRMDSGGGFMLDVPPSR